MSSKPPIAPRSTTTNRVQPLTKAAPPSSSSSSSSESSEEETSDEDDKASIANTDTTDTTLVNDNELLQVSQHYMSTCLHAYHCIHTHLILYMLNNMSFNELLYAQAIRIVCLNVLE